MQQPAVLASRNNQPIPEFLMEKVYTVISLETFDFQNFPISSTTSMKNI
jgi:hypothetical protein